MLLTRRDGSADPGKTHERRGRVRQITDNNGSARVHGFPLVDEKRGELSGSGELLARTDLDRRQGGHLELLSGLIAWSALR